MKFIIREEAAGDMGGGGAASVAAIKSCESSGAGELRG